MKVMMIQLPHFYEGTKRTPTIYPLGIGYLVSVLKNTHELIPLDLWIENARVDKAIQLIEKNVPDIFCISIYSTQYPYYKELVSHLKEKYPNIPVIAGGPGATFSYRVILEKTGTDICVIGEGEIVLGELLDNFNSYQDVNGIAFMCDNKIVVTAGRKQIQNIDSLPFPDRKFFDFERYVLNSQKSDSYFKNFKSNTMITSRGCPYHCTFCSKTFTGSRIRSIENIDKEIHILRSEFGINAIEFDDELVLINKKRALNICKMMKKHEIQWGCQGRINIVDEEILLSMKESGCIYVGYGVESYTQSILNSMKKKTRVENIIPVIQMTKRLGIIPVIQYMYGFPGENDESIEATYKFFKKIDHPYIGMITTPLPGTPLYDDAIKKGFIGDEESYLMKLTSGYNYAAPLANFTEFTDKEFIEKRTSLERRINWIYYIKHPLYYFKSLKDRILYRAVLLFKDPSLFFSKLLKKVFA